MGKEVLYLIGESSLQESIPVKVRYLYKGDFNTILSNYLSLSNIPYFYLSTKYGLLDPDCVIEPYSIKDLSKDSLFIWSICCYHLISRYMKEKGLKDIVMLSTSGRYEILAKLLLEDYKVDEPIKYYVRKDLQVLWVKDLIQNRLENKLCN